MCIPFGQIFRHKHSINRLKYRGHFKHETNQVFVRMPKDTCTDEDFERMKDFAKAMGGVELHYPPCYEQESTVIPGIWPEAMEGTFAFPEDADFKEIVRAFLSFPGVSTAFRIIWTRPTY
jgi:hypothetical protein